LMVDCAGSQIGGLATLKRGNSLLGLHQGTPLLSSPAAFAPVGSSCWCGPCALPLPSEGFEQAQRWKPVSCRGSMPSFGIGQQGDGKKAHLSPSLTQRH
jgi:hypothetical protein